MIWKKTKQEILIDSPFVVIEKKWMIRPGDSKAHGYFHFRFPDFCNVIAFTEKMELVMVRQFRMGIEGMTLEVPGGVVDAQDRDPARTALRELKEETGFGPNASTKVTPLGWSYPNPAIQDNRCHFYAIGPVEWVSEIANDETESTELVLVPAADIEEKIRASEIRHALTLNAFQFLQTSLQTSTIPQALARLQV